MASRRQAARLRLLRVFAGAPLSAAGARKKAFNAIEKPRYLKVQTDFQQRFDEYLQTMTKLKGVKGKEEELLAASERFLEYLEADGSLVRKNSTLFAFSCSVLSRQFRNLLKEPRQLEERARRLALLVGQLYQQGSSFPEKRRSPAVLVSLCEFHCFFAKARLLQREVFEHLLAVLEQHSEETDTPVLKQDTDEIFCYAANATGLLMHDKTRTRLVSSAPKDANPLDLNAEEYSALIRDRAVRAFFSQPGVKAYVLELLPRSSLRLCNFLAQGYSWLGVRSVDFCEELLERYLRSDYSRKEDLWGLPMACYAVYQLYLRDEKAANSLRLDGFLRLVQSLHARGKQHWDYQNRLQVDSTLFHASLSRLEVGPGFFEELVADYPELAARADARNLVFVCRAFYLLPQSLVSEPLLASFVAAVERFVAGEFLDGPKRSRGVYGQSTLSALLQTLCSLGGLERVDPRLLDQLLRSLSKDSFAELLAATDGGATLSRMTYFFAYLKFVGPSALYQQHAAAVDDFLARARVRVSVEAASLVEKARGYVEQAPGEPRLLVENALQELLGAPVAREALLEFMYVDFLAELPRDRFVRLFGDAHGPLPETVRLVVEIHGPMHFFPTGELNVRSLLKAKLLGAMGYKYSFLPKSFLWLAHGNADPEHIRKEFHNELRSNMDLKATAVRKFGNLLKAPSK